MDTLFPRRPWLASRRSLLAMYYDQGHIPVQLLGHDEGRRSPGPAVPADVPDHGAAFDIAGLRRPGSMTAAIRAAAAAGRGDHR